jgi:hypothetical protein
VHYALLELHSSGTLNVKTLETIRYAQRQNIRNPNNLYVSWSHKTKGTQHESQEEFEDNKGVIRIRISKDRQHNGQKKKYKRINNDLQSKHIKLKIE